MLLDAQRRGVNEAVLKLLHLYSAPGSALKSAEQELKIARIAIHLGYAVGYESWVRSHVEKGTDYRNQIKTFQFATEGADAGNAYSAYIAGRMLLYGSGVDKDTRRAAMYLEIASRNGHEQATRLLQSSVAGKIQRLQDIPSYPANSCVSPRRNAHDGKIIDYFNKCSHGIYALVCSRHVATELWSLLDNSDREYCKPKYVAAGRYIGNFYGADKESSIARKAISNVSVNIYACHPPLKPKREFGKTRCVE